jgi:hypothetical protein
VARRSGTSEGSTTKSPAGALTSRWSPTRTSSCRKDETIPSGEPRTPRTRRTVIWRRVPDAVEETVYCRGDLLGVLGHHRSGRPDDGGGPG